MKISRIEIFRADLPLKQPFRIALGETRVAETVFVRIHTDRAIHGVGEASLFTPIVTFGAKADLADLVRKMEQRGTLILHVPAGGYSDAPAHDFLRIAVFSTYTTDQIDEPVDGLKALLPTGEPMTHGEPA